MGMLKDRDKKELSKLFGELSGQVKLVMFTQEMECEYCQLTREMVEEIAALSDRISAEVHDFVQDASRAKEFGVDKIPAIVVMGDRDYGIRFYGIPAGYEFSTFIETILDVSRGEPGLPQNVMDELAKVDKPVHMQVMVTPT
jgi:glutaredoxin-like protein